MRDSIDPFTQVLSSSSMIYTVSLLLLGTSALVYSHNIQKMGEENVEFLPRGQYSTVYRFKASTQADYYKSLDGNMFSKRVRQGNKRSVQKEVAALRKLNQANCPFVPRLLNTDEVSFITTEHVGEPLTRDNLPADWDIQIQRMLIFMRDNNIEHNDIKPQNMLVQNGRLYLVDFGISGPYRTRDNKKRSRMASDDITFLQRFEKELLG